MLQDTSLTVQHLRKSFSQGLQTAVVLDDVTYTFKNNHQYALTGVSGIGKSTLIQVLAGLDKPDRGSVLCNGIDIYALEPHRRSRFIQKHIGFVFQYPSLIDELSVLENVMLKGLIADNPMYKLLRKHSSLLEKVGLVDKASHSPRTLSGGEQQRVSVARALFTQPNFILADEPTAHLDEQTKSTIIELLSSCAKNGLWGSSLLRMMPKLQSICKRFFDLKKGYLKKDSRCEVVFQSAFVFRTHEKQLKQFISRFRSGRLMLEEIECAFS